MPATTAPFFSALTTAGSGRRTHNTTSASFAAVTESLAIAAPASLKRSSPMNEPLPAPAATVTAKPFFT